jgi:hypothetical protein
LSSTRGCQPRYLQQQQPPRWRAPCVLTWLTRQMTCNPRPPGTGVGTDGYSPRRRAADPARQLGVAEAGSVQTRLALAPEVRLPCFRAEDCGFCE